MRTVSIVQSSYIPWRGYFSLIASSDVFIVLDSVQFTRRDWRSRNRIKTAGGPHWLTVPVRQKGHYRSPIEAIEISDSSWPANHLASLHAAYARAPAFGDWFGKLSDSYERCGRLERLSEINLLLMNDVCSWLGIETRWVRDVELLPRDKLAACEPTERLVRLAAAVEAERYLSGPSAKKYLQTEAFEAKGLSVAWADYEVLPKYSQLWGEYDPAISVLDALFNLGAEGAFAALGPAQ